MCTLAPIPLYPLYIQQRGDFAGRWSHSECPLGRGLRSSRRTASRSLAERQTGNKRSPHRLDGLALALSLSLSLSLLWLPAGPSARPRKPGRPDVGAAAAIALCVTAEHSPPPRAPRAPFPCVTSASGLQRRRRSLSLVSLPGGQDRAVAAEAPQNLGGDRCRAGSASRKRWRASGSQGFSRHGHQAAPAETVRSVTAGKVQRGIKSQTKNSPCAWAPPGLWLPAAGPWPTPASSAP